MAEDAAQQALLRAWKYSAKAPEGDPAAWVRVIARREALRIASRRREVLAAELPEKAAAPEGSDAGPLRRLIALDALGELSENEQFALLLHYWGDLSQPSIASVLRIPLGTVKIRIHRAQAKLSRRLQETAA